MIRLIDSIKASRMTEIKNNIDKAKVISFDIFDTLIKRDCCKPVEVFSIIEDKLNKKYNVKTNFQKKRIKAEEKAIINNADKEITINDIYKFFPNIIGISKNEMIMEEEQTELNLCQPNQYAIPIYTYCIKKNKRIIIVSDMYLKEKIIKKILDKANIRTYEKIYLSSECGASKKKGNIFKLILKDMKVSPQDIIHIGDDLRRDYISPKRFGLRSVLIGNHHNNIIVDKSYKNNIYRNLLEFINNHYPQNKDLFYRLGFEVQGPLLLGFVKWLNDDLKQKKIKKLFFLSRDGQIMQRAFSFINPNLDNRYLYVSRKSLIIPTIWMSPELADIQKNFKWPTYVDIVYFLEKIGLDSEIYSSFYADNDFNVKKKYISTELFNNDRFIDIYNRFIKNEVVRNSKAAYNVTIKYLKQEGLSGKIAIVDIGWHGSMQEALLKILNQGGIVCDVHGYYIGLRKTKENKKATGYLFNKENNRTANLIACFTPAVEIFFSADHGTVLGYKENSINGEIVPLLAKWEFDIDGQKGEYRKISMFQDGALAFVKSGMLSQLFFCDFNRSALFVNWIKMGSCPSQKLAAVLGNMYFEDNGYKQLAKLKHSRIYYLLHLQKLYNDMVNAPWHIGFMTQMFSDKVPNVEIYRRMRDSILLISRKIRGSKLGHNCNSDIV